MQEDSSGLTIEELAERVDVPVRTVRFYIAEGILAGSGARGKASFYGIEHLLRLMLIRRLTGQRVPLKEIKDRLSALSLDEIRVLLAEDVRREEALRQAEMSPRDYISSLLDRARLMRETASPYGAAGRSPAAPSASATAAKGDASAALQPPSTTREPLLSERGRLDLGKGPAYPASLPGSQAWQRWELAPGVELHVRNDRLAQCRDLVEQLVRLAMSNSG